MEKRRVFNFGKVAYYGNRKINMLVDKTNTREDIIAYIKGV